MENLEIEKAIKAVFTEFDAVLKTDKIKNGTKKFAVACEAKSDTILDLIGQQLKENHVFNFEPHDSDSCSMCRGVGKLFQMETVTEKRPCKSCQGTGIFTAKCKRCDGTGRYIRKQPGVTINVTCKAYGCVEGTKKVTCRNCQGKKEIDYAKPVGIKKSNTCPACNGSGKKEALREPVERKPKQFNTSVKEQLKDLVIQDEDSAAIIEQMTDPKVA